MEKNRKPDYFYIDTYDRSTIRALKELEVKQSAKLKNDSTEIHFGKFYSAYRDTAILRARARKETVQEWIRADENKDRLVQKYPLPSGITCDTCGKSMKFTSYAFNLRSIPLLFIFDCPANHVSRKAIYPNGQQFFLPRSTCKKCGYEVAKESYSKNNILYTITTCSMCGSVEKGELDLNIEPEDDFPISDEDRQKYCLSFFGERTFFEDFEALVSFSIKLEQDQKEQQLKDQYEIDKIEMLTIPSLEKLLQTIIEKEGFIKLCFDRPEMKRWAAVPFNLQDPTDRNEKECIKTITHCIKQALFTTNWRMTGQIEYRLGFLTGKVRAYESEEDLLKLAIEIKGAGNEK
jgi:RNase P subunit RPR2